MQRDWQVYRVNLLRMNLMELVETFAQLLIELHWKFHLKGEQMSLQNNNTFV